MLIDAVDVFHVAHPMREPWTTAYGSDALVHAVLVRISGGGVEAWAESSPLELPTYSPEYASGVFQVVGTVMAPCIVGRELDSAAEVVDALSGFKGNSFAKAALEIGWWQLQTVLTGRPLFELLGGKDRPVAAGEALGVEASVDDLLARIDASFRSGYQRIKLKVSPERDLVVLREVRRAFPDGAFHIDCNCGYTLDDWDMFEQLDELGLVMIEQPLGYGDVVDHAKLQRRMRTAICLDESCSSVPAMKAAIDLESCRIVNIKPPRVGGLANSLEIAALCGEAGIDCWVGSMLESSIGASANLALASLPGIELPSDVFPSRRFYDEEITEREFELCDPGLMRPLAEPASALTPMPTRLEQRTIAHRRVTTT